MHLYEYFKLLNEANQADYPKHCNSFMYRIHTESDRLACASIVLPRNVKFPDLGFNIVQPYIGPGSMASTGLALSFLTEEDARNFADKYDLPLYNIYITKTFEEYVRADNTEIPIYLRVDYIADSLVIANQNVQEPLESVNNVTSAEIREKNARFSFSDDEHNNIEEFKTRFLELIRGFNMDSFNLGSSHYELKKSYSFKRIGSSDDFKIDISIYFERHGSASLKIFPRKYFLPVVQSICDVLDIAISENIIGDSYFSSDLFSIWSYNDEVMSELEAPMMISHSGLERNTPKIENAKISVLLRKYGSVDAAMDAAELWLENVEEALNSKVSECKNVIAAVDNCLKNANTITTFSIEDVENQAE